MQISWKVLVLGNLSCTFRKPILENMGIDIDFIRMGLADLEIYSFLCCSSMQMPSSGKNTKAMINQKPLDQFLQN